MSFGHISRQGGNSYQNNFFFPFLKVVYSKTKYFDSSGSKFFPFREDSFRNGMHCRKQKIKHMSQKLSPLLQKRQKTTVSIHIETF